MENPFLSDVCRNGLSGSRLGGVQGSDGSRALLFDADGTRQGVRQRALPEDESRPPLRRRSAEAAAPGYGGRKRGEAIRSRMTVQQSHTSEWLGTFGGVGNGEANTTLAQVCDAVVTYLAARELPLRCGVLRLDGEHGWAHRVSLIRTRGLGYLLRCCDYRILRDEALRGALSAGAIARIHHADSGITRELFDLPSYVWSSLREPALSTRLVIARWKLKPDEKPSIGKEIDGWAYELIVTDRSAEEWDAAQVYSLYQGRGAFESSLAQEDREMPTDQWVSFQPQGQEFWQILCQWVWNLRLRAGALDADAEATREPLQPEVEALRGTPAAQRPIATSRTAPSAVAVPKRDEARASSEALSEPRSNAWSVKLAVSFGSGCFERRDARTVVCPAGVTMRPSERVMRRTGECVRYQAPPKKCAACEWSRACRGHEKKMAHGHRVTLPVMGDKANHGDAVHAMTAAPVMPRSEKVTAPSPWERSWRPTELWLVSLSGGALRRAIRDRLREHRVRLRWSEFRSAPAVARPHDRRAHRRRTWALVWSANALRGTRCSINLTGISESLSQALRLLTTIRC